MAGKKDPPFCEGVIDMIEIEPSEFVLGKILCWQPIGSARRDHIVKIPQLFAHPLERLEHRAIFRTARRHLVERIEEKPEAELAEKTL